MLGWNPTNANHDSFPTNRATRLTRLACFVGRGPFRLRDIIIVVFVTCIKQLTCQLELGIAISVGHEAGMANLPESTWEHV